MIATVCKKYLLSSFIWLLYCLPFIQTSIASVAGPPSPATIKKLLRIRMMSEMVRTPAAGNIVTIPTQVADISADWVKMVVNQWKVGCC